MDEKNVKLSLKEAAEHRSALLAEAERGWRDFLKELELLIPRSMRVWALEKEFLETTVGDESVWRLPEHIENTVKTAAFTNDGYPGGVREKYLEEDVQPYGFADLEGLELGFLELAAAWEGIVRIRLVYNEEEDRLEVWYYAAELTPEWPPDEPEEPDDEE